MKTGMIDKSLIHRSDVGSCLLTLKRISNSFLLGAMNNAILKCFNLFSVDWESSWIEGIQWKYNRNMSITEQWFADKSKNGKNYKQYVYVWCMSLNNFKIELTNKMNGYVNGYLKFSIWVEKARITEKHQIWIWNTFSL